LNEDARKNLGKSFESIKRSFDKFESAAQNLDELIGDNKTRLTDIFVKIHSIMSTLSNENEQLANIIQNFSSISDSLAKANLAATVQNASVVLEQASDIMKKINNGEGTMGMLINDDSLYNNLEAVSKNLDLLIVDINEHPKRYIHFSIFGKKDKK